MRSEYYGGYQLIHPTCLGRDQDTRDKEYTDILNEVSQAKQVIVWNVVNNNDGTFHTLGLFCNDKNQVFDSDQEEELLSAIREDVLIESDESDVSYDPASIFNEEDFSFESYDPRTEEGLRKITEYLDCWASTESLEYSEDLVSEDFDNVSDFIEAVIASNENSYIAFAKNEDESTVLLSIPDTDAYEDRALKGLPILFSDVYTDDVALVEPGYVKTKSDILNIDTSATDYDCVLDMVGQLFDADEEDFKDSNNSDEDTDKGYKLPEEGPSSEGDEYPESESEANDDEPHPVETLVIETTAYKAQLNNRHAVAPAPVLKTQLNFKSQPKTQNKLNLKDDKMNILAKLNFKPIEAAVTFDGLLAIDVNTDPSDVEKFRAVDKDNNLIDVEESTIAMKAPLLMPVMGGAPEIGDYVQQGNTWYKILDDKSALNLDNGTTAGLKVKFTQFFKQSVFYRAMFNPAQMMGGNAMMMLALLGDKEGEGEGINMKDLMMMSMLGGNANVFGGNPLMAMMLFGGKGGDMKDLLMMSMLSGNQNPFGNLFGATAPAKAAAAEAEDAAPSKPNRRK